jgi:uncharacterized protein (DUF885 family)
MKVRSMIFSVLLMTFVYSTQSVYSKPIERRDMSKEFAKLAAVYEQQYFNHFPEQGLFWGKVDVPMDRFTDYSPDAYVAWRLKEDNFLRALQDIDPQSLQGTPHYNTYLLLKETLENNKGVRICKEELWDVNPAFGWHNKLATVAEKQPVGTPERRAQALERWQTFPAVVQQQINNLQKGMDQGYTAPKPAVERVLMQIKLIAYSKPEESPYYDFAQRDGDMEFKARIADLVQTQINPSLQEYIAFLEKEYLPKARTAIGASALPSGDECYQAKIKQETTLTISPREIHDLGLQYMQKLSKEVAEIGAKKYGTQDMAQIFKLAKDESTGVFNSEQEILNYNMEALKRIKARAPQWFDIMPRTPGILKPYPLHRAKTGASGEYNPPTEDGSEPGIFYINTYQPEKRSRIDQEATLFHELIPGHHFQVALQYEDKSIPSLNHYLWNSGYGEGWALYVERLADEMGVYDDEISRLGMLSNESLRASRLVVDTGIHVMNWNRQQAIEYLTKHTALSANIIQGEVDRYIMLPAQATSYMLGKLEIEKLRQQSKDKLGSNFDIRQFHNQVLKNGVLTLPMLNSQIESWLNQR